MTSRTITDITTAIDRIAAVDMPQGGRYQKQFAPGVIAGMRDRYVKVMRNALAALRGEEHEPAVDGMCRPVAVGTVEDLRGLARTVRALVNPSSAAWMDVPAVHGCSPAYWVAELARALDARADEVSA